MSYENIKLGEIEMTNAQSDIYFSVSALTNAIVRGDWGFWVKMGAVGKRG